MPSGYPFFICCVSALYKKNVTTGVTTTYYFAGATRVAMRQGSSVYYLHGDHLGSTSLVTTGAGEVVARQLYLPYGAPRWGSGTLPTDFTFTGQRADATGLMYYRARYYSSSLGRFLSADTIVPGAGNPQSLNRYSYVRGNPLKFTDPTGHGEDCGPTGRDKCETEPLPKPFIPPWSITLNTCFAACAYDRDKSAGEAVGLVAEWFLEEGPEVQRFGPDSSLTQDIRYSPAMENFHKKWKEAGYPVPYEGTETLDKREGPLLTRLIEGSVAYGREHVGKVLLTFLGFGSKTPGGPINLVGGTIGSLDGVSVKPAGKGYVLIEVYNEMGWKSAVRVPGYNVSPMPNLPRSVLGPGGSIYQYFYWVEPRP